MLRFSGRPLFVPALFLLAASPLKVRAQIQDATPNPRTVSIAIGAPQASSAKVPPTLFGAFLEPIGDSINHGLSAEILTNPSLESGLWNQANIRKMLARQPSLAASSNRYMLPLPWRPLDPKAGNRFELEDGHAANSWQSLEIMGVPGFETGIKQRVYLPAQSTLTYHVSLYVKHLQGGGKVTVMFLKYTSGQVLAQSSVLADQKSWTKYQTTLKLSTGQVKPLQPVDFAVEVAPNERADIDQLSLMPADAVDGFDPRVIAMAKAMHVTELRFGGNFTSTYHWRYGIGPKDKRISMENPAWGIPQYNYFGTVEFLTLCHLIHAVPQFDLNMGSGTPQEAAAWVRYIREHYDGKVLYELGNELWGRYQVGWVPQSQIAARTVAFSKAVRAVDPHAILIATGERPQRYAQWNAALLTDPPGTFNYLSTHFIRVTNSVALAKPSPDFLAAAAYALPYAVGSDLEKMQKQVNDAGDHGRIHFAMTEWLFASRGKGYRIFEDNSPSFLNAGGALLAAGMFNTMIRTSPIVTISDMTGLMDFAGIRNRLGQVYAPPAYYAFRMYSTVKRDTILPVHTDSGNYNVHGGVDAFENLKNIPYIDAVATLSRDKRVLTVFCINRDTQQSIPVRFNLAWFHPQGNIAIETLNAVSRYAVNSARNPRNVIPRASSLAIPRTGTVSYVLPRESVTMLRFRNSGD